MKLHSSLVLHAVLILFFAPSTIDAASKKVAQAKAVPPEKKVASNKSTTLLPAKKVCAGGDVSAAALTVASLQDAKKSRTITVKNDVTTDMITYKKHYTGSHTPNEFSTKVNNMLIEPGKAVEIPMTGDEELCVSCCYRFKKGPVDITRTKEKKIKLDDAQKIVSVQFSWDNDDRVILVPQELKAVAS